jgi:hypothetical protein
MFYGRQRLWLLERLLQQQLRRRDLQRMINGSVREAG